MRLYQIPFSHNCIKVRRALELKGLDYESFDINPVIRRPVRKASGQSLVPALVDKGRAVAGSTRILLYLDEAYPQTPLLPADPAERAECLVLADWADGAFMEAARRLAYSRVLASGSLGALFFPGAPPRVAGLAGKLVAPALRIRVGLKSGSDRRDAEEVRRAARLANARLAGDRYLVGGRLSLADLTLATMSAPLQYAGPPLPEDPAVRQLLEWGRSILGEDFSPIPPAGLVRV